MPRTRSRYVARAPRRVRGPHDRRDSRTARLVPCRVTRRTDRIQARRGNLIEVGTAGTKIDLDRWYRSRGRADASRRRHVPQSSRHLGERQGSPRRSSWSYASTTMPRETPSWMQRPGTTAGWRPAPAARSGPPHGVPARAVDGSATRSSGRAGCEGSSDELVLVFAMDRTLSADRCRRIIVSTSSRNGSRASWRSCFSSSWSSGAVVGFDLLAVRFGTRLAAANDDRAPCGGSEMADEPPAGRRLRRSPRPSPAEGRTVARRRR